MTDTALRQTMTALPLVALLALAGCGGGGGGSTAGGPQTPGGGGGGQMPGGGTPTPEPLMAASGLRIGEADATTGAATLSSTADRSSGADRVSISGAAYIKSVSDDGSGGFSVTYVSDGDEVTIAFASGDLGATQPNGRSDPFTYYKEVGGEEFYFWRSGSRGPNYHQFGSSWQDETSRFRTYVAVGAATDASALPGGTAIYRGSIWGDLYDNDEPNPSNSQARTRGRLTLTAHFSGASLEGRIYNLQIQEPGSSGSDPFNDLPQSSQIRIHDGRIVDGQFTAELTGEDDDSSVAIGDSARGFEGDMVGAFYGPAAEEVGGVFNAKRANGGLDQVLVGRFGGEKFGPTTSLASDALVAGIDRVNEDDRTTRLADDGMARVERTENGWSVTVDGQTATFDDADDYGALARFSSLYWRDLGNQNSVGFWTNTGGFGPNPSFDHFDVKGWNYITWGPGADPATANFESEFVNANQVFVLHGNRTPAGSMPATGTGTYTGSMSARDVPTDDAISTGNANATSYRGDVTLTAAFGSSSVGGRLFNLESRPGDGSRNYAGVQGDLTFDATINGNRFTASAVTGTEAMEGYQSGSVRGAFFGPAAEEAGGVFDATGNNRAMFGWFGGKQ